MESYQIMVFGEGGVVLAPPSLEPRVQSNLRWLRPPWESPPARPSSGLCRFIKEHAPVLPQDPLKPEQVMIPWTEIFPVIRAHPEVLQALLAPAPSSDRYYQHLLKTAQGVGLDDPQVLLGLLWHAPQGNSHSHPQRAEYLTALVKRALAGVEEGPWWEPEADSRRGTTLARSEGPSHKGREADLSLPEWNPLSSSAEPHFGGFARPPASPPTMERLEPAGENPANGRGVYQPVWSEVYEAWGEMSRFSHENLVVERRRYEAMIYELGKLGGDSGPQWSPILAWKPEPVSRGIP